MQACLLVFVLFALVEVLGQYGFGKSYEGFQLIRARPLDPPQLIALRDLRLANRLTDNTTIRVEGLRTRMVKENGTGDGAAKNPYLLDFWSEPIKVNKPVDLMVPPNSVREVQSALDRNRIQFDVLMHNVQEDIDLIQDIKAQLPRAADEISFKTFNRLDKIYEFLEAVAEANPEIASTFSIGHSSEGRVQLGIKIGRETGAAKPAVWIDAGIHAREWIAPAVATFIIDQLVNNYNQNHDLVDEVDWYIMPVLNPDGYEYTFTNSRLWRKTRSKNPASKCLGADANRNFAFHWNKGGVSDDPCDETFRGVKAFSEPEAKNMADFLLNRKGQIQVYLSLHAYGQMWLTPWGYTAAVPNDYADLIKLATRATKALQKVRGTKYTIGSSTNVLYIASGGSDDWAKGLGGIKYSYTVELNDEGEHGFLLPASQILKTAKESFEAIRVVGEFAADLGAGRVITRNEQTKLSHGEDPFTHAYAPKQGPSVRRRRKKKRNL